MRALVVVNPNATTTSERTRDVLLTALGRDLDLEVVDTTHRGHARELAAQSQRQRFDIIIAFGGDGTVNEVVNGVIAAGANPQPLIGIIPGGSTNVLARNLGIPENPVEATGLLLDALRAGRRHSVGLGRLGERYFTFTAGVGLDADVIRTVEDKRAKGRSATLPRYVRTAVRRFFAQPNRRHGSITLETADGSSVSGLSIVIVSNSTPWTYLGARPLRATSRVNLDGGLDVLGLAGLGMPSTLWRLVQMTTPRGPRGRNVVSFHDQQRIVISAKDPLPVQVDGDFVGEHTSVEITSAPDAIEIAY